MTEKNSHSLTDSENTIDANQKSGMRSLEGAANGLMREIFFVETGLMFFREIISYWEVISLSDHGNE